MTKDIWIEQDICLAKIKEYNDGERWKRKEVKCVSESEQRYLDYFRHTLAILITLTSSSLLIQELGFQFVQVLPMQIT